MWETLKQAMKDVAEFCANWNANHLEPVQGSEEAQAERAVDQFCANWDANHINEPWAVNLNQGGEGAESKEPFYTLLDKIVIPIPKWMRTETRLRYEFHNQKFNNFFEAEAKCAEFFEQIFDEYVKPMDEWSRVRMYIDHPLFTDPINMPQMLKSQFTPSVVYKNFYDTLQSKKKLGK
jgi:hypothetical protein